MFDATRSSRTVITLAAAIVTTAAVGAASGSVDYATPGATYAEDFDSLANTGDGAWVNNATLAGFYAFHSGATSGASGIQRNAVDNVAADWQAADTYETHPTSYTSSTLWSWGGDGATERGFGAIPGSSSSNQAGDFFYALALRNTTGQTLQEVTISYTGEQWREGRAANDGSPQPAETLELDYQVFEAFTADGIWTNDGTGGYTPEPDLTFTTPTTGNLTTTPNVLDGNAANHRATLSKTIAGVDWADGEVLVIRWWHDDAAGFDHGLGIDDLSVTASVPEPACAALMALGLVACLGRRV